MVISMKSRKNEAVSAVVGTILMVGIVVAIAITTYAYTGGLAGTEVARPSLHIDFKQDDNNNSNDTKGNLNKFFPKWRITAIRCCLILWFFHRK